MEERIEIQKSIRDLALRWRALLEVAPRLKYRIPGSSIQSLRPFPLLLTVSRCWIVMFSMCSELIFERSSMSQCEEHSLWSLHFTLRLPLRGCVWLPGFSEGRVISTLPSCYGNREEAGEAATQWLVHSRVNYTYCHRRPSEMGTVYSFPSGTETRSCQSRRAARLYGVLIMFRC